MAWTFRLLATLLLLIALGSTAGAQWKEVYNGGGVFYNEVFAIDADHAWVTEMGSSVVRTTNGGTSWQSSTLPNATGSANRDICFVSTSVGYVSGSDGVWKSTDGGSSWTKLTVTGMAGGQSSIWFRDANIGIFAEGNAGNGIASFFSTTDGGSTWGVVYDTSTSLDAAVGGITYMNGKFYVAGGNGNLWRSSDDGATWTRFNTGSNGWQEDLISFGGKLYIASADGTSYSITGGGKVLFNTTSDVAWGNVAWSSTIMWGVTMYTSSNGWACGEGGKAYRTTDGWSTWSDRSCGIDPLAHIDDIWFADATHGWAVGQARTGNTHGAIYQYVGDYARAIPDTIDFGEVLVGTTSPDFAAKVQSIGQGLVLTRAIAGNDPTQFGATGGLSGTQSPGYCGDATTLLHFNPTSIGQKRAYLEYTYANGTPGPRVVLLGRGVKPDLVAPGSNVFDTLQCSAEGLDTVIVGNNGFYPLTVSTATVQNTVNGTFQLLSPTLPVTIPIGTTRQFIVRATATGPGVVTGALLLGSNDVDRTPWQISLSAFRRQIGVGFDRDTLLTVAAAPINQMVSVCINYRNTGNAPQKIDQVVPVGPGFAGIVQTPSISGSILRPNDPPVSICFQVTPTDTGWHTQRFRVRTGPCGADTFVTVRVYGTNPIISSVSIKSIGDVCGTALRDSFDLFNRGNVPLVVQQPTLEGVDRAQFTLISPATWPVTIAPGRSVPIVVRYAAPATGSHTAALRFRSNDRGPNKEEWVVTLSGTRESVLLRARERSRDVGSICLGSSVDASLNLWNEGTATVQFTSAVALDAPAEIRLTTVGASTEPIANGRFIPLPIHVDGLAVGEFSTRVAITYGPCDLADTVTITGRVVSATLSLDRTLDLGELPIGVEARRAVNVRNIGTIPATLRAVTLSPPDPNVQIVTATLPLTIAPGSSTPVEIIVTPQAAANVRRDLVITGEGLCADTIEAPLTYDAIAAQVISERSAVLFEPLLPCLSDAGRLDTVQLRNFGSTVAQVTNVALASGGGSGFSISGTVPSTVPASGSSTIGVLFRPSSPGTYRDTLMIETIASSTARTIRIPLSGTSERLDLSAIDDAGARIDAITIDELSSCTPERLDSIVIENFGTLADTVTVVSSDPALRVTTAMPVIIPAGEKTTVALRATTSGVGGARTADLRIVARTCSRESIVTAAIDELDLTASLADVDYRTVNIGKTIDLNAEIHNSGTTERIIERVVLDDPTAPFTVLDDLAGRTIAAGETLLVPVRYAPIVEGNATAKLVAALRTPCEDTLRSTVQGIGVKSNVFIGRREIDFGASFRCDSKCQELVIEGTGDRPVTITGATIEADGGGTPWTVTPNVFPMTVLPGESLTLTLCFDGAPSATPTTGRLKIVSDDLAQPEIEIPLEGRTIEGLRADSVISFTTSPISGGDTTIIVHNGSDVAITIDRVELPAGFTILDPLPLVVPPSGELAVRLSFRPDATGATGSGTLVLAHTLPCADSVVMRLSAGGLGVLTTSVPDIRGRWGQHVRVPVTLDNPRALALGSIALDVTADPRLLHPLAALPSDDIALTGWSVDEGKFDPVTGAYSFTLQAPSGATAQPAGVVAWVEYEVLRGESITTPITPLVGSTAPGVSAGSIAGTFILEDYCDAYGRLLKNGGAFKLSQNTPNPVTTETEIEFEVPFAGPVTLSIHDGLGRELARPIDEWLPAGTRRLRIDGTTLPSGVYTYQLRAGLLVESRRMVISR
jgi:photosystem II stability/assembly factor-like uncharacterized protein